MGILLAIHVIVTILLILVVLIQKNEGGSSLFANSGGNSMFNARGTSNILTKTTWVLASIFLVNCVVMATIESSHMRSSETIIDGENNTVSDQKNKQPKRQTSEEQSNPNKQAQAEQTKSDGTIQKQQADTNGATQIEKSAPARRQVSTKQSTSAKQPTSAKSKRGEKK